MMTGIAHKKNRLKLICVGSVALLLLLAGSLVSAKENDKALDEQVQDVKSEVLSIARELDQLEQQLLYPSHTQIAIFVSLREDANFTLGSVDLELDGKEVAHHLYTDSEREAFVMGGVQRIYTGNVAIGAHDLKVTMRGKSAAGNKIRIDKNFSIEKEAEPGIAELMMSEKTITLINR